MTLKLQPRRLIPCHRHPDQPLTSLCAPCLRERLSHLSPSSSSATTGLAAAGACSSSSAAALPELRRSKTFSADKCESLGLGLPYDQPRRRSCEVRSRSSLEDLLTADDDSGGAGASTSKCKVESKNLGLLKGTYPVPELREEENEDEESDCEIRVSAEVTVPDIRLRAGDLDLEDSIEEDSKTIKEFIDLEFEKNKPVKRDFKEIAGSFWIAASVFSKKFQKWKGKQKSGRPDGGGGLGEMRLDKLRGRRLRDVQTEAGECGLGRRSCDSDPRFSIDLGRASIDGGRISVDGIGKRFFDTDPRFSLDLGRASVDCGRIIPVEEARQGCFDAPRASWDGYMNGRMAPRGPTPMVSVIENAMATVYGFDNEDRKGYGAIVARHMDSVSLHVGKKVKEDEKPPGGGVEIFHGTKLLITEKELMDSRMSSLKDDSSDSFDTASKDMTSSASSSSTGIGSRKSRKWGGLLNVWSLLSRPKQCKSGISDPLKRGEREGNEEEVSSDPNWKLTRSHSVLYKGETEAKSMSLKTGGLERNRSARYSPNNVQNGMLRFYLTPLRGARQKKLGKNRLSKCHSSGRSVSRGT